MALGFSYVRNYRVQGRGGVADNLISIWDNLYYELHMSSTGIISVINGGFHMICTLHGLQKTTIINIDHDKLKNVLCKKT